MPGVTEDGVTDAGAVVGTGSVPFSTTSGACSTVTSTFLGAALAAVTPTASATARPAAKQRGHALFMRFAPFCGSPDGTPGVRLPRNSGREAPRSSVNETTGSAICRDSPGDCGQSCGRAILWK